MKKINPDIPDWMLTAPRFAETWSDKVVDLTPNWEALCQAKVDPQPGLTRHATPWAIPVETVPDGNTMFPDDILSALGKENFPNSIYILTSISEGHAVARRNDGSNKVVGLVCFERRRAADLACRKPSHQHFSPLLVKHDDAIEIALAIQGVELQALILIRDPEGPLFHYIR